MSDIVVTGASKAFGKRVLFEDLTFEVPSGQLTAVTGHSGSGKSTLLNCIGLLETLTRGSIHVGGNDITRFGAKRKRRFRRDSLGYMFQNYALIESLTIRENLEVAIAARGPRATAFADFDGALTRVGLEHRGREKVYRLSGGEQQRVALARVIIKKPTIILADEPTGALDAANADMVLAELKRIAENGAAVIIATHSQHVADNCAQTFSLT